MEPNEKSLDEIVAGHIVAYGGISAWEKVEALEVRGRFTAFSETNDFFTLKTACGKFFSDYSLGKHRLQEWYDGKNFRTIDPWQGFEFPRKINRAERHVIMQKAELLSPFFRWEERGLDVVLEGTEVIDGKETYKLAVTRPGKQNETWYLDTQTLLVYKSITPWIDFATATTAETWYDDYRKINGIVIPHFMETIYGTRHTTTEIDQVIVNPFFDSSIFSPPACSYMAKLNPLTGAWNVTVEYMTRSGNLHVFDEVVANFAPNNEKLIGGQLSYEVSFPVSTHYTIHFNHRTQKYQLVVYNEFYSTTDLYEGSFEGEKIVFSDATVSEEIKVQTPGQAAQPLFQFVFNLEKEDNFVLERNRSMDGGETWHPGSRYSFRRM